MRRLLPAVIAVVLMGCATPSVRIEGRLIDKAKVLEIRPGETTRTTIIETFGNPVKISSEGDTEKMIFLYRERKVPAYFGGLVENETSGRVTTTTLEVTLSNGVVQSYNFNSTRN